MAGRLGTGSGVGGTRHSASGVSTARGGRPCPQVARAGAPGSGRRAGGPLAPPPAWFPQLHAQQRRPRRARTMRPVAPRGPPVPLTPQVPNSHGRFLDASVRLAPGEAAAWGPARQAGACWPHPPRAGPLPVLATARLRTRVGARAAPGPGRLGRRAGPRRLTFLIKQNDSLNTYLEKTSRTAVCHETEQTPRDQKWQWTDAAAPEAASRGGRSAGSRPGP